MTSPTLCQHLSPVLSDLIAQGAKITYAGQAWSENCRIWVYLDVQLNAEALMQRFQLPSCVVIHSHNGTHDGRERGLYCDEHQDAIMGLPPGTQGKPVLK